MIERLPTLVGCITAVTGVALVAAPGPVAGPLGLAGREDAARVIGVSDLVLAAGLLRGRPKWAWMAARTAVDAAVAAYLVRTPAKPSAAIMSAITVADGATAFALRGR